MFRNPFLLAPIKTGYGTGDGKVTQRHLSFYEPRSRHVGAVIPEPFYLDPGLRELPTQMGIDGEDKMEGLSKLVDTIHDQGASVIAHLNHPGRMANPKIPGNVHISSTDRPCESGGATPRRMDEASMQEVVTLFTDAARRVREAGFDALELQLGHGYLLAQFLSPLVNDRDDEFGGDLQGRMRFPLQVVDAVREAVDLPLFVRVSGAEMVDGGIQIEETVALALALAEREVEAVHVSAGTVCSTPPWYFQHMFVPEGRTWEMAEKVRDGAGCRVVVVGRVNDLEKASSLRDRFEGQYLAVGRALVADPDFVGKVLGDVQGPVRPCLACAEGCLGGVKSGQGLRCLVNPLVGREEMAPEPSSTSRYLAVVGGGLAGMQAAITARERGHKVELFEEQDLGGQFNLAPLTPHKKSMSKLVPYMTRALKDHDVSINWRRAEPEDLRQFDGVVVATGSRPRVPEIAGLDRWRWADILADEELPENKHVMIIGGGLIGVDIATALIPRKNRITIVKRTTDFGEDMEMIAKKLSLAMMKKSGTTFSDHTHVQKVDGRTVHALRDGEPVVFEDVDIIVFTTGMQSVSSLASQMGESLPTWVVGDARQVGNAQDAITDAFLTVREI